MTSLLTSQLPYQSDDLAQDAELRLLRVHYDGFHGGMLRLEHDGAPLDGEALHGGLVVHQSRHDVSRHRGSLLTHEDQIAVGDVGLDHAVAGDAESEHLAALGGQPLRTNGDEILALLRGEDWRAGCDLSEDRDVLLPTRPLPSPISEDEGARGALVGDPPLEHPLALERAQVIEGGSGREAEPLGDLPYRGRGPVFFREASHEAQHLTLPLRHLPHRCLLLEAAEPTYWPAARGSPTYAYREHATQHHNSQHPLSWPSKKNQAGSHGSQEGQGWRDASFASATRLKYTRSGSLIRRTQPHSRVWKSLLPRWATKASPGGASVARPSVVGASDSVDSAEAGVAAVVAVATSRGAGSGVGGGESISSIWRLVRIVDSNSALAFLNSRMARPSDRPSWGRFFGPKTRSAITKMRMSSWRPMSNISGSDDTTPVPGEVCLRRSSRLVTLMTLHAFASGLVSRLRVSSLSVIVKASDRILRAPKLRAVHSLTLVRSCERVLSCRSNILLL